MKRFLLLTLLFLAGCANDKLVALNEQYSGNKIEMTDSCFLLSTNFKYDTNNNFQYASDSHYFANERKYTYTTLTTETDDAIFDYLLKAIEICSEDSTEYAKYKDSILKVQNEKAEKEKATKIAENEKLKKEKEEEARKIALSKKYSAEWCDGGILSSKNRCLFEGEFQIFEQQRSGTLVKPRISMEFENIQMIAALSQLSALVSMTTGKPDELNRNLDDMANEMQQLVFIEPNPLDSNQIDGAVVKGLFLRDGIYKYTSLSGTRTVKKIKRLE